MFHCDINPAQPYWEYDIELNDGSKLRLRGLNSTLVSNEYDDNVGNKLILGSFQSNPKRQKGVEYITLCHHPPQWLRDQDSVEGFLRAKARIQLFGHKHNQNIIQIDKSVHITAGATHPNRRELEWLPRYNYLAISVKCNANERKLCIKVFPRVWSKEEKCFQADYDSHGAASRSFSLPIDSWEPSVQYKTPSANTDPAEVEIISDPEEPEMMIIDNQGTKTMNPARRLTYRFLSLPYDTRLEVARELRLIEDDDEGLQGIDLFKRFFKRAKEKQILGELWDAVEKRFKDGQSTENPFSGR